LPRWREHPEDYLVERLGWRRETIVWSSLPEYTRHKWDGDPDPLLAVLKAVSMWKWVAVESGIGTGKTRLGAGLALYFLEVWENSLVITTAPKRDQLGLHIWREIQTLYEKFGYGELGTLRLRMKPPYDDWSATGFVAGVKATEVQASATKAQGFHAEHMLIICEETPGIHDAVMTALQNTSIAPHNVIVAFGNPDHQMDTLHRFAGLKKVEHIRISGLDHPNVVLQDPSFIPGAQTQAGIDNLIDKYKSPEHPLYISRARGISPSQATDALIRWEWCKAAAEDEGPGIAGPGAIGVDVANSADGDEAAICEGKGSNCIGIVTMPCPNNLLLAEDVYRRMMDKTVMPEFVGVDAIGVGAGTVNKLYELGAQVVALQSGAAAQDTYTRGFRMEEQFENLRAQMWWQARVDLQFREDSGLHIPEDPELWADLCTPKWKKNRKGKILVEAKEEIKKRLGRSPNKGDSFVYWNWVRARRVGVGISLATGITVQEESGPRTIQRWVRTSSFHANRRRMW
jgi:hypothetical protein